LNNVDSKIEKEYIKIGKKLAIRYRQYLSKEDIERCINIAYWKVQKFFSEKHGTKTTSYFYNIINNEFRSIRNSFLRDYDKKSRLKKGYLNLKKVNNGDSGEVDFMDLIEICGKDKGLIYSKFALGKSISEISKEFNMSEALIRSKIKKNLSKLKRELSK